MDRAIVARRGDVLLNSTGTGTIGRSCVFNHPDTFVIDSHVTVLRPKDALLPEWLCLLLQSQWGQSHLESHCYAGSTNQVELSRQELSHTSIPVPSLREQRRIAEMLAAITGSVQALQTSISKNQVMLSAFIQEKFSATDTYPCVALGSVASVSGGVTLGRDIPEGASVELPYLRVANVQDGYFDCTEMKRVRILQSEISRYSLESGDLVLTEGGDIDKLGRGAVWDGRISPCLHQNHLFRVRCGERINPHYLALYASSTHGRAYFLSVAKQTTNLATINSSQVKSMPVPCPSLEEQNKVVAAAQVIEEQIYAAQTEQEKLHVLKQSMADDLLTGRVRVCNIP
ncbi:restriction endonuclease subunit S [Streptomyces sp. FXJ1.4098]|nr:restriction endonuclease subunit S [Streptomyces sp. FXJ1.4098]